MADNQSTIALSLSPEFHKRTKSVIIQLRPELKGRIMAESASTLETSPTVHFFEQLRLVDFLINLIIECTARGRVSASHITQERDEISYDSYQCFEETMAA